MRIGGENEDFAWIWKGKGAQYKGFFSLKFISRIYRNKRINKIGILNIGDSEFELKKAGHSKKKFGFT